MICSARYADKIAAEVSRIQKTARRRLHGWMYWRLFRLWHAETKYVRPKINEKGVIDIKDGRHPVVEQMMRDDLFIANDTYLDNGNNRMSIITGPNMAGKSTYMRQTALIVPHGTDGQLCSGGDRPTSGSATGSLPESERLMTWLSGQSTFMVEMTEVANILRNATNGQPADPR